jgi:tRNA(fMet)-specific endonuclease VapC
MYLLDTDTVSHHQHGHERVTRRIAAVPASEIVTSTITVAEQMRGCWNAVNKARTDTELIWAYDLCRRITEYYSRRTLVDFTQPAADRFRELRRQGTRIGTQDLRIAAIALTLNATLVTCNTSEFRKVGGITVEDWTA